MMIIDQEELTMFKHCPQQWILEMRLNGWKAIWNGYRCRRNGVSPFLSSLHVYPPYIYHVIWIVNHTHLQPKYVSTYVPWFSPAKVRAYCFPISFLPPFHSIYNSKTFKIRTIDHKQSRSRKNELFHVCTLCIHTIINLDI